MSLECDAVEYGITFDGDETRSESVVTEDVGNPVSLSPHQRCRRLLNPITTNQTLSSHDDDTSDSHRCGPPNGSCAFDNK